MYHVYVYTVNFYFDRAIGSEIKRYVRIEINGDQKAQKIQKKYNTIPTFPNKKAKVKKNNK